MYSALDNCVRNVTQKKINILCFYVKHVSFKLLVTESFDICNKSSNNSKKGKQTIFKKHFPHTEHKVDTAEKNCQGTKVVECFKYSMRKICNCNYFISLWNVVFYTARPPSCGGYLSTFKLRSFTRSATRTAWHSRPCPSSVLNQARSNWCESWGMIILGPATTLQQSLSPRFSLLARIRMNINDKLSDWVNPQVA